MSDEAAWVSEAVQELAKLRPPHRDKKQATIIALVDARISGVPEESVWSRAEVCSRNIYHSKWKRDPIFAGVLAKTEEIARNFRNAQAVTALMDASKLMQLAAPTAANQLIGMATRGVVAVETVPAYNERRMEEDEDILRAVLGLLDRAGVTTASKNQQVVTGSDGGPVETKVTHDLSKLSLDELRALRDLTAKAQSGDTRA